MNNYGAHTSIPTAINVFYPQAYADQHYETKSSNWDQAALATVQVGWGDVVFVDASYRQDWYRPFRQFKHLGTAESYGYFGFGANAVLSDIIKLPKWFTYAKYRLSYSEVGNSIPNIVFDKGYMDLVKGTITTSGYASFKPVPEKTKSFETGLEMQFFRDRLNFDVTYYNSAMCNSYLTAYLLSGKTLPVNSGVIRNQGVELTVGYDWKIDKNWRWNTSANFSYNFNKIEEIYEDPKTGENATLTQSMAESAIHILFEKGGKFGDMYIKDYARYDKDVVNSNGDIIHKTGDIKVVGGTPQMGSSYNFYAGNMNSPCQISWSNTFSYKDFTLYFLINGRIGGKTISMTEFYLDRMGNSKRSGDARLAAESYVHPEGSEFAGQKGLYINKRGKAVPEGQGSTDHAMYINNGRDLVSIKKYYEDRTFDNYIYDATNFRLRELSLGYTFRNLFGEYKNLSLSFVCRNLFFIYKDSPVDPDISLGTGGGLGGFDMFNLPSTRSFGFNLKLNL